MQNIARFLTAALPLCLLLTSCDEGWTDEKKAEYRNKCISQSAGMYANMSQTEAYCDCNLEVIMKHYPTYNQMVENKDSLEVHKALQDCSVKARQ